jgi:hypothetical protein
MTGYIFNTLPVLLLGIVISSGSTNKQKEPRFEAQTIDSNVQIGYGLAIGDVNGDGKEDILLADKKQFVWYRNGDWKRFVMAENLTDKDNVCIAARDIDGDGLVEVAVGAQWNPGETSDVAQSGSVHYLVRPEDPTQAWQPVKLPHVPTVHRMRWVRTSDGYQLVMLPLHGIGNKDGQGAGVQVISYTMPSDPESDWEYSIIDQTMHLTHNFEVIDTGGPESLLIGGKEGAKKIVYGKKGWMAKPKTQMIRDKGFGEIRASDGLIAGIQPMHGNELVIYRQKKRKVLTDELQQGHALELADLLELGQDQVLVGWRNENASGDLGIKLFIPEDSEWNQWSSVWIDKNGMACEDLKVADLNDDGRLDIIAAGRSTNNLKIYWNR